jgi:hypothetical protein
MDGNEDTSSAKALFLSVKFSSIPAFFYHGSPEKDKVME